MNLTELLRKRRTIRKYQQKNVPEEMLRKMISCAVCAPCGVNAQALRYTVVRTPEKVRAVLEQTRWGAQVTPRRTPHWGKDAPDVFIAVRASEGIATPEADAGAAIMILALSAAEQGLGSCWIGAFDRAKTAEIIGHPGEKILYLLAVGYPAEEPVMEFGKEGSVRYYLDEHDVLHVPKLPVETVTEFL